MAKITDQTKAKAASAVVITVSIILLLLCALCLGTVIFLNSELPGLSAIIIPW